MNTNSKNLGQELNYQKILEDLIFEVQSEYDNKNINSNLDFINLNKTTSNTVNDLLFKSVELNRYYSFLQNKDFSSALDLSINMLNYSFTSSNYVLIEDWFDNFIVVADLIFHNIYDSFSIEFHNDNSYDDNLDYLNKVSNSVLITLSCIQKLDYIGINRVDFLIKKWSQNHEIINKLLIERFNEN